MKTEVKKIDSTKRELNIEVSGEIVKNKFEDIFKKISQQAKVPGFRPGHVPRDILEKHYSGTAHQEVIKELIPDIYGQAVQQEGLDVIDLPEITEVKLDGHNLSFKATVETSPEIELKNYKNLKLGYKKAVVSAEELKRSLDAMKEARKIDNLDDKFARGLGYPDLAQLEKAVETQLLAQKQNQERQKVENEIVEQLTKELDFKIPQSMIKRQLEELLRQAKLDLALKGVPREKIIEEEKALSQELELRSKDQVKVYLILSAIARKENIKIDDHMPSHVMEFLLREADWQEVN